MPRISINPEKQDRARRAALASMKENGGDIMAKKRIGLTFETWQEDILKALAHQEGIEQVATFIKRDLLRIYPILKQRPKVPAAAGAAGGASPGAAGRAGAGQ